MPELPEVETTRRGIAPLVQDRKIFRVALHQPKLRWRVPAVLGKVLPGETILSLDRRAKYLLLRTRPGTVLIHLGMTGSLRVLSDRTPPGPHDRVDFFLSGKKILRFRDPRRFGSILWTTETAEEHPLLRELGPEPLGKKFHPEYLYERSRGKKVSVKNFLMNSHIVAGVGNIYANEALYRAGIHPRRSAGRISSERYAILASKVKAVLKDSIKMGGTTLRDFTSNGQAGYFRIKMDVYDRAGEPCRRCDTKLRRAVIGQRSTFFCPGCQR